MTNAKLAHCNVVISVQYQSKRFNPIHCKPFRGFFTNFALLSALRPSFPFGLTTIMTKNDTPLYYIECLKQDLAKAVNRPISTYSDFNYLSLRLNEAIADAPSISTLKRLWNYVPDSSSRSRTSLNALCRFLGFRDWPHYVEHLMRSSRVESGFLDAKSIMTASLTPGDTVSFGWNPERTVVARFLGDDRFEVVEAANAKLLAGMTFTTALFAIGSPLQCAEVVTPEGEFLGPYVAGSRNGLTSLAFIPASNCGDKL